MVTTQDSIPKAKIMYMLQSIGRQRQNIPKVAHSGAELDAILHAFIAGGGEIRKVLVIPTVETQE